MIPLTRFDGSQIYLNADLIEMVESTPDTHITLINGHRYLVREPEADVIDRILQFHQATASTPRRGRRASASLRVISSDA